jgi:hypothetical protein
MMQAKSRSESKRICIQTDCAIAAALKDEIERLQEALEFATFAADDQRAKNAKLREAIERSMLAIDDWLNVYAETECDADRVAQAKSRIRQKGTIGYIADVQKQNREAIAAQEDK